MTKTSPVIRDLPDLLIAADQLSLTLGLTHRCEPILCSHRRLLTRPGRAQPTDGHDRDPRPTAAGRARLASMIIARSG